MNKIFLLFILSAFFATASVAQTSSVPSDAAAQPQASYLYDLKKLIAKSRENIKEVNQKIKEQAVLKRNQAREERARAYYEKGMELTNEGKLEEARDYFDKAIRITKHPEMAGYIRTSQQRLKKQESALHAQERQRYHQIKQDEKARKEDVEASYKEAVDLYKQKKYHPAKDAFEHVDEIAPDYRAVGRYLKIVDQDIVKADAMSAKQQALEIARQQKEAEAARLREKQMWMAQIKEKEKERKEAINKQAADVYAQAVELYKDKKFVQAKKKFEEVSWVIPDYKATMKYLARIDRDAQKEQERAEREGQKALQQERWEQEVERKKQEVLRQRELKAKELQKKKDLQEQAQFLYQAAVTLFDRKNRTQALEKFNEVENTEPGFKSTRGYIARIKQWQFDQQKRLLGAQGPERKKPEVRRQREDLELKKQEAQKIKDQAEALRQKELTDQRRRAQELKDKTDQARKIYALALRSYRNHQWEESKAQFESVEKGFPNFKHTRRYLQKVDDLIAREAKAKLSVIARTLSPSASLRVNSAKGTKQSLKIQSTSVRATRRVAPTTAPSPVVSMEDQQQQAQEITTLAQKSAQLYRQIADISDDKYTAQTKRKMAQVQHLLSKAEEEERRTGAKKMYQEAVGYFRSHDWAQAKIKFLALESIFPDYGATHRYLSRIEEYKKRAIVEAVITHEQKENAAKQTALQNLAQKASDINDDIIRLSRQQDYEAMKAKFTQLENTVTALTALKTAMAKPKEKRLPSSSVMATNNRVKRPYSKNFSPPNATTTLSFPNVSVGNPEKALTGPPTKTFGGDSFRLSTKSIVVPAMTVKQLEARREAIRKQLEDGVEAMYQEALSLYKKGDYTAAADKFKDVGDIIPGYKRTGQYIHEAKRKSLHPQPVIAPVASPSPPSRQESVSQTLDLFDSHVQ